VTERPGQFPFTRGDSPQGPDPSDWFSTYYSGSGTATDTNKLFKERFAQSSSAPSLLLAMDLPTQVGLDPDNDLAVGEVGRIGVAVSSLDDILALFDGIGLDSVTSGTVGNSIGVFTCPLFERAGADTGVSPRAMNIVLQNDPLKEYTGRGTQIFPIATALELSSDVVEYVHKTLGPTWKPQYTCSTQMRWGGVSAAQEIGFGLANMITYVESAARRQIDPAAYLARTDLHMSSDEDFLGEVAKFRAARRTWATILERRFGRAVAEASPLKITVFTAGNRLTAQRPLNNIVRTTTHVLAAMLGGVHEILVPGYDEALGLPTRDATALTNATKEILHYESGIGRAADQLGGSEEVERLTDELTEQALEWFDLIEEKGGMVAAISEGFIHAEMTAGTYHRQLELESGERRIVGLNHGDTGEATPMEIFEGNPNAEAEQVERVRSLRASRAEAPLAAALLGLHDEAEKKVTDPTHNLVPAVGGCVEAKATVGEIFDVLREAFGTTAAPTVATGTIA
jgi:methylmalonyl-CoA mutase N-terminal domain/subunit